MSKRPKVETPSAIDLLVPARHTREVVPEFRPMVLFAPRKGQPQMAVLDSGGTLDQMLSVTLEQMRAKLGPAEWIAVTSDAYVKRIDSPGDLPEGRLAEAFEAGDPTITEQLIVLLNHRYSGVEMASQAYRWTPADQWEWDTPIESEGYDGMALAVLRRFM